jgi:F0F1-type ATP synthase alpha subunit
MLENQYQGSAVKRKLAAYRALPVTLRLSYSQFENSRPSKIRDTLDEATLKTLERGHRVRERFSNSQNMNLSLSPNRLACFLAVTNGVFDNIEIDAIDEAQITIRKNLLQQITGCMATA